METTDREIYEKVVQAGEHLTGPIEIALREAKKLRLYTKEHCLVYLGLKKQTKKDEFVVAVLVSCV